MMRRMKHGTRGSAFAVALALGIAGVAAPASAQPAAALGKPLSSPDLPVGTVSVRIIAGSVASPVVGTSVTLVVNNVPREARTDAAGRATFAGLPAGATVLAKVVDEDKAEHASEPFAIPAGGGMRVMISTKPITGGGGGAPFAGGGAGAGMPNPRQLSGQPRPDQGDPAGTLTILVSYDDFKDPAVGGVVALVGYAADDSTNFHIARTDNTGRVTFRDLDRSGGTAYFAMTLMVRNGAIDRIMSMPVVLDSQHGLRMALSSEKRDSTAPAIDDLSKGEQQGGTPAGKVRIALEGAPDPAAVVTLIDASTKKVIAEAKPETEAADPTQVKGGAQFTADPKLPPGTLDVTILGGAGTTESPMPGIELRVMPAASTDLTAGFASVTGADGTMRMAVQASGPQKAVFTINGRPLGSQAFELTKSGGRLVVRAHWDDSGRMQATFDVAAVANQVLYAETLSKNQRYRSMPFHPLPLTGTKVSVYVFPRAMFRFSLQASVEDQLLATQGRFEISNYSWAPYRAGPDGLLIPLPHGFKGGVVFGADQAEVSVAAGEGFRIVRPIPPGGRQFHGGFSLANVGGNVNWSFDLPLGSYQSELDIKQTPGMTVRTPPGVPNETRTVTQGTFTILGPIGILPRQRMDFTIEGMPAAAAWRTWVPRVIGVLVVGVILTGLGFALAKKPERAAAASVDARRQRLLEALVELEREGGNPKRREQLLHELEQLWG
jgi:hypothetical protein